MNSPRGGQAIATSIGLADQGRENHAVKSGLRVLLILELLTAHPAGLSLAEICRRLSLPRSSAHGLLHTMTSRAFLEFHQESRRFKLGIRTWEAGQAYMGEISLATACRPYLQAARDALHETVQLAILDGIHNVYLAKEDADQLLGLQSRVGARLPAYATGLGKVLLAGLDDDEVRYRFRDTPFVRFTHRTIGTISQLLNELAEIRCRGYGLDNGEYTDGVECIAVPVRNYQGNTVAAISVSVPAVRGGENLKRHALEVLSHQSAALSKVLGYESPSEP